MTLLIVGIRFGINGGYPTQNMPIGIPISICAILSIYIPSKSDY